jgi:dephospho-CoA kinase
LAVVWCGAAQQVERAIARGVPAEVTRQLLAAQLPIADKRALADVVIDNSGRPDELESEVRRAWAEVLDRCRRRLA